MALQTFMFCVFVNHGNNRISQHFTNCVQSKNDGALLKFRDRDEIEFNIDATTATIVINVDEKTHIATLPILKELKPLKVVEAEKLNDFLVKYYPVLTSADIQSFSLGLTAGQKLIKENSYL